MLPESVSAVLYVANVVAVVHMVADNVVYSHGSRHRSALVRSGASKFAPWASAVDRPRGVDFSRSLSYKKTLSLHPTIYKDIDMNNFAAIDFETANECSSSVCSVGVVIVRNGEVADSFYSLIHPEPEYYKWFCRQVHGLGPEDTEDAPVFPEVWEKIAPLIEGLPLVAHNSRFDEKCLKSVFNVYRMDYPDYEFYDTLAASRRHFGCQLPNHQLQTVASACGYDLTDHHHALADAEACAAIALKIL